MREDPDRANDPDDDSWDSLFVELPTATGAPTPGAKLITKGSYGVSYLLTVERVVQGRPLPITQGTTTLWEIKGTRRPLMPGE